MKTKRVPDIGDVLEWQKSFGVWVSCQVIGREFEGNKLRKLTLNEHTRPAGRFAGRCMTVQMSMEGVDWRWPRGKQRTK